MIASTHREKKEDFLLTHVPHSSPSAGAGVSTAAGIADYRGPTGVWTRQRVKKLQAKASRTAAEKGELELLLSEAKKKGKDGAARGGFGLQSAEPTSGHMVMSTLVRHELAQHVVTTNLDGLHRKSGLQHHRSLTCLHGDIYIERCTACAHEIERDYHVRNNAPRKLNVHDHSIGTCPKCGSKPPRSYTGRKGADGSRKGLVTPTDKNCGTKDTHINFGESLDDIDWDEAERVCEAAALCIVVGTSMSLDHVTHMPFMSGRTVIINLQKTPYDKQAHLRIFAHADVVLNALMERLAVPIDPVPEAARRGKKEVKKLLARARVRVVWRQPKVEQWQAVVQQQQQGVPNCHLRWVHLANQCLARSPQSSAHRRHLGRLGHSRPGLVQWV